MIYQLSLAAVLSDLVEEGDNVEGDGNHGGDANAARGGSLAVAVLHEPPSVEMERRDVVTVGNVPLVALNWSDVGKLLPQEDGECSRPGKEKMNRAASNTTLKL